MAPPLSLPTSIIHQENSSTDLSTGQDNRGNSSVEASSSHMTLLVPSWESNNPHSLPSLCQLLARSGPYFLCSSLPSDSILDWESCRKEKETQQIGGVGWVLLGGAKADSWSSPLTNEDRDPRVTWARDGVQGVSQGLPEALSPGWVFLCYLVKSKEREYLDTSIAFYPLPKSEMRSQAFSHYTFQTFIAKGQDIKTINQISCDFQGQK